MTDTITRTIRLAPLEAISLFDMYAASAISGGRDAESATKIACAMLDQREAFCTTLQTQAIADQIKRDIKSAFHTMYSAKSDQGDISFQTVDVAWHTPEVQTDLEEFTPTGETVVGFTFKVQRAKSDFESAIMDVIQFMDGTLVESIEWNDDPLFDAMSITLDRCWAKKVAA